MSTRDRKRLKKSVSTIEDKHQDCETSVMKTYSTTKISKNLKKLLTNKKLQNEVAFLLRRSPFINNGDQDEGYMCRDHSFVLSCLGSIFGVPSGICWGEVLLTGKEYNSERIHQKHVKPHSWSFFDHFGFFDLSIDYSSNELTKWDNIWSIKYLMGNKMYPTIKDTYFKYYLPEEKSTWLSEFSKSLYRENPSVIYFGETFEDLSPQFIEKSVDRINSPLTDELKSLPEYNPEIYCKAVLFLFDFINFKQKSLSSLDQHDAWDYISKKYPDATTRVIKACKFKQT